jgi:DNA-directed RNA polymerase II subunit RPB2
LPNSITITCPNISKDIPIFIIFRALGIESDKEILEYIVYDIDNPKSAALLEFLRYSVLDANKVMTQLEALEYLKSYVEYNNIDKVKHVLVNDLFPNVGNEFRNKAMFLGHLLNKLVRTVLGIINESDRDNYIYKRVDISGFLVGNLFRDYYNQFRNSVRSSVDKQYLFGPWKTTKDISNLINKTNIASIFKSSIIEDGFRKSLKGSWGKSMVEEIQDSDSVKQGIVQDLSRISYMGFMSHIRRVNTPMDPTSKIVAPHRLHPSQWGIMCPIESPDGASVGLLKHFAILCHVTFESGAKIIGECLKDTKLVTFTEHVSLIDTSIATKVSINSNWIGITFEPEKLFKLMRLFKKNGFIDKYVSISWDIVGMEINISTEAGRCVRPVYVVEDGSLLINKVIKRTDMTWTMFTEGSLKNTKNTYTDPFKFLGIEHDYDKVIEALGKTQAVIEYLDVEETNGSMIAMDGNSVTEKHTHCEIHPSVMLGAVSQNIPLCNHNQAPRNIFFGSQSKQAVGTPLTSFNNRIDTMLYVLHYPQKQLVNTRYKEYLNNNVLTGGENLIVAISTWTGYNQEDSIIINKASMERGMFNMTYFKNMVHKEEDNPNDNERIIFKNPLKLINDGHEVSNVKFARYTKTLDDDGYPKPNVYVYENDAIIGKTLVKTILADEGVENLFGNKVKKEVYSDKSVVADKNISGIIDKVYVYQDTENNKTCKLRFRKVKQPELGDKMASTCGQKGVIGLIIAPENMPFNKDGIVPDIIINPHAFPSRMTIGHLLECVLSKTCVNEGMMVDATPFNNHNYKDIYEELEKKFGLDKYGNEIMYNGRNGEQIETEIFFGPTYYQRLKHMVSDKINYRTTGAMTATTRQPTQGRGNNGGLRIGEMERDTILSHGINAFLKESMMERSDKYSFDVEKSTGDIAITSRNGNKKSFKPMDDDNRFYDTVQTPYAFKLLVQEMKTMSVKPILCTDELDDEENYDDTEVALDVIEEDVDE